MEGTYRAFPNRAKRKNIESQGCHNEVAQSRSKFWEQIDY
jgi:hypothetical protein